MKKLYCCILLTLTIFSCKKSIPQVVEETPVVTQEQQKKDDINQKAVVFTESKRTQKYIANELRKNG